MPVVLRLAWRHLSSKPRQTALTVAGVALGVAVFVFTVSMMDGLVVFFTQRLIRTAPLLTVLTERIDALTPREALAGAHPGELVALSRPPVPDERPTIRGATALAERLRAVPGLAGVSVAASVPAVLALGPVTEAATLIGIEPEREREVTELPALVGAGDWDGLARRRDGAVLGWQLAERLGAAVGDRLVATGETGAPRELEVVGIISSGLGSIDEQSAFVTLPMAQALAGWSSGEGSEIRLRSRAITGLAPLARQLEALTGYEVETWQETSESSLQLFRMIGMTTYLLTGFVLLVAGLGIANKLTTIILEKERDIAILRSFGFGRRTVRTVFVIEGVAMGGLGAALGCLIAAGVIRYFTLHPIRFAPREGSVMAYTELFLNNDPRYYAAIAAAALAISLLAALLATRRALKVVPVEVLRGTA